VARDVAILTTSYPQSSEDAAGHFVEAHAFELARAGARVTVLAPGTSRPPRELGAGSIRVVPLGGDALFRWPGALERLRASPARALSALPFALRAARALRGLSVDRVVAHWVVPCAWPLTLVSRAPMEAWAHGADVRLLLALPRPARSSIVSTLIDRGTSFRFVARRLLEQLAGSLPPPEALALRETSVVEPAPILVPSREELAMPEAARALERGFVVWVGRLVASKRIDEAAMVADRVRLPLVVIGDGPEPAPRAAIALGRLPRRETLRWIAHARALLSTSREEGAPTVVREARALGVPVVAEPAGDIERWAADDPGIAVARGTSALAAALALVARG
jgi:glycosyltransferase involved in cell wall biosynthesis